MTAVNLHFFRHDCETGEVSSDRVTFGHVKRTCGVQHETYNIKERQGEGTQQDKRGFLVKMNDVR